MGNFGLLPEGLLIPTLDDLQSEMEADARTEWGPNFPLGTSTLFGFLVVQVAERLELAWQSLERVYVAGDRDKASGLSLRSLGLIIGAFAPDPSPSFAVVTFCGDDGFVIPDETIVRTPDTLKAFRTRGSGSVTLQAAPAWVSGATYAVKDRVSNSNRIYQATFPGISGSAPGPITTDLDIADGAQLHWTYLGEGGAVVDSDAFADEDGPTEVIARGLTQLGSVVAGVNTVTNLEAAVPGVGEMTDEDFRILAEEEVALPGTGPVPAIEAELADLTGVTSVTVFENLADEPDENGVDAHSIEALVQGGVDQDIREVIFANKPAGTGTSGNVIGTVTDSRGKIHTIRFSRPVEIPIYVDITVVKDPETYTGDDSVKTAVASAAPVIGLNAVATRIGSRAFAAAGVIDVPRSGSLGGALIGLAPSPTTDATIVVTTRQLATFDVSRVTVHSSDGEP